MNELRRRQISRYPVELLPPKVVYIDVNLTNRLRAISALDMFCARLAAASAAIIQVWDHGVRLYRLQQFFAAGGEALIDQTYMLMHLRIGLALVMSAISLWFRNVLAFCLSIFGGLWVVLEYWLWHLQSQRILVNAGIEHWPTQTPHALGLGGATGWNAAVLLLTLILLLWQAKTLVGGTRHFRHTAV